MANIFLVTAPGCGSKIAVRDAFNVCRATGSVKNIVLGKFSTFDECLNDQIPSYEEVLTALNRQDTAENTMHNVILGWWVTHYADRLYEQFKDNSVFVFVKRVNTERRSIRVSKSKLLSKLDTDSVNRKIEEQITSFVSLVEAKDGQWRKAQRFVFDPSLARLNQRARRVPKDYRVAIIGDQSVLGESS